MNLSNQFIETMSVGSTFETGYLIMTHILFQYYNIVEDEVHVHLQVHNSYVFRHVSSESPGKSLVSIRRLIDQGTVSYNYEFKSPFETNQ